MKAILLVDMALVFSLLAIFFSYPAHAVMKEDYPRHQHIEEYQSGSHTRQEEVNIAQQYKFFSVPESGTDAEKCQLIGMMKNNLDNLGVSWERHLEASVAMSYYEGILEKTKLEMLRLKKECPGNMAVRETADAFTKVDPSKVLRDAFNLQWDRQQLR